LGQQKRSSRKGEDVTFAERYNTLVNDPTRDSTTCLYLALAQVTIPNGTAEEWETLAARLAPPDLALMIACAEIEAAGGAA
jgi:hypothetical protein